MQQNCSGICTTVKTCSFCSENISSVWSENFLDLLSYKNFFLGWIFFRLLIQLSQLGFISKHYPGWFLARILYKNRWSFHRLCNLYVVLSLTLSLGCRFYQFFTLLSWLTWQGIKLARICDFYAYRTQGCQFSWTICWIAQSGDPMLNGPKLTD